MSTYNMYNDVDSDSDSDDDEQIYVAGSTCSNLRKSGLGFFTLLCKIRFMFLAMATVANSAAFSSLIEGTDLFEILKDHILDVSTNNLFIVATVLLSAASFTGIMANSMFYVVGEVRSIPSAAGLLIENFSAVVVTSMVPVTCNLGTLLLFSLVYTTLIYTIIVGHYRVQKSHVKCVFYFSLFDETPSRDNRERISYVGMVLWAIGHNIQPVLIYAHSVELVNLPYGYIVVFSIIIYSIIALAGLIMTFDFVKSTTIREYSFRRLGDSRMDSQGYFT